MHHFSGKTALYYRYIILSFGTTVLYYVYLMYISTCNDVHFSMYIIVKFRFGKMSLNIPRFPNCCLAWLSLNAKIVTWLIFLIRHWDLRCVCPQSSFVPIPKVMLVMKKKAKN